VTSPLPLDALQDPRTQLAVDTIFRVRVRCSKLVMLVLWVGEHLVCRWFEGWQRCY